MLCPFPLLGKPNCMWPGLVVKGQAEEKIFRSYPVAKIFFSSAAHPLTTRPGHIEKGHPKILKGGQHPMRTCYRTWSPSENNSTAANDQHMRLAIYNAFDTLPPWFCRREIALMLLCDYYGIEPKDVDCIEIQAFEDDS